MFRNLKAHYQAKILVKNMTSLHNRPFSSSEISFYISCLHIAIENRCTSTSTIWFPI